MDDKKKKKRSGLSSPMNLMIHMAAGAYLIYLAYNIYSGVGAAEGNEKIVMPLAVVLFGVIGAVIIFSALRSLMKGEYQGGAGDPGKDAKEEEMEEKTVETGRIRFGEIETIQEKEEQ